MVTICTGSVCILARPPLLVQVIAGEVQTLYLVNDATGGGDADVDGDGDGDGDGEREGEEEPAGPPHCT